MTAQPTAKPLGQKVWDLFASVKLSFFLLLVIAVAAVLGTVIPQHEPPEVYVQGLGPGAGKLVLSLGLDHMYQAPWFLMLLACLAANLVVCSVERLPLSLKAMRVDPAREAANPRPAQLELDLGLAPEAAAQAAQAVLTKRLAAPHRAESRGVVTLFAHRGAWSRLGVYGVHVAVLVILLGAVLGSLLGFSGFVNIQKGETLDHIHLDDGAGEYQLPFSLRLDDFAVSFYDNGMPSEYKSQVTFLRDGQPAQESVLLVNQPADFMGVRFYQASYGDTLQSLKALYTHDGKSEEVSLTQNQWTELPDGAKAGVMMYRPEVKMGQAYQGPAAQVAYAAKDQDPVALTALKAGAKMMGDPGKTRFEILEAVTVPYSGLQVKKDPGVWLIWLGCSLMVLGFVVTFYFSHRKVWVVITARPGGSRLQLSGTANKNRAALNLVLARLRADLAGSDGEEK